MIAATGRTSRPRTINDSEAILAFICNLGSASSFAGVFLCHHLLLPGPVWGKRVFVLPSTILWS